jgi:hypothetical protein
MKEQSINPPMMGRSIAGPVASGRDRLVVLLAAVPAMRTMAVKQVKQRTCQEKDVGQVLVDVRAMLR